VVRVKWSLKQASALDAIAAWLRDPNAKQTFYLAGLAGSGKSTLVEHVVGDLRGRICYGAPTGKAALVMRRKGCPTASTIHKLAYLPAGDPPSPATIEKLRAECKRLYAINEPGARATADKLAAQLVRTEQESKRKGPRFTLNLDSEIRGAALCVVDECSMIDVRMGEDLESFGTKLLVIGDPAQLPPVYGAGYFTSREPDAFLDEIHRQALDSPILRLADLARRGQSLPYGKIGEGVEVLRYGDPSLEERALVAEMIIVGRNRTRHACNAKIRRLLGRANEPAPVPGDRVICLRNNHELGLLNGSTWTVERCLPDLDKMTAKIEVVSTEDSERVECETWLHHFMAREDELEGFTRRTFNEWGYGYCQTVHKSQGSGFDNVLLFDESRQFGRDASRHLYTGVTRASRALVVVQ
jgi:exodeoxyribonuclease-5